MIEGTSTARQNKLARFISRLVITALFAALLAGFGAQASQASSSCDGSYAVMQAIENNDAAGSGEPDCANGDSGQTTVTEDPASWTDECSTCNFDEESWDEQLVADDASSNSPDECSTCNFDEEDWSQAQSQTRDDGYGYAPFEEEIVTGGSEGDAGEASSASSAQKSSEQQKKEAQCVADLAAGKADCEQRGDWFCSAVGLYVDKKTGNVVKGFGAGAACKGAYSKACKVDWGDTTECTGNGKPWVEKLFE